MKRKNNIKKGNTSNGACISIKTKGFPKTIEEVYFHSKYSSNKNDYIEYFSQFGNGFIMGEKLCKYLVTGKPTY